MPYREGDKTHDFEGKIEHATEKAYLVNPATGGEVWVPRSQIAKMTEPDGDGNILFTVTDWWYSRQKDL